MMFERRYAARLRLVRHPAAPGLTGDDAAASGRQQPAAATERSAPTLRRSQRFRRLAKRALCLATYAAVLMREGVSWSVPATFITALPVSQDQVVVRFTSFPELSMDDPTTLNRELGKVEFPTTLLYGATSTLALALEPEQEFSFVSENTAAGRLSRSASGFADTLFFARYTLVDIDWPRNTLRLAPLAGAYLPTGYYNKSDFLGRLPSYMQSGSGSVDPFFGLTAAWYNPLYGFSWDATYRYNPPASSGFRLGDEARTDGSLEWRVWPWTLPATYVPNELWGELETNLIWDSRSQVGQASDLSTGGLTWVWWIGLQYPTIYWELGAEVGVPVVQNLYGHGRLGKTILFVIFYEYYVATPSWR
jgi:hypothetical protein